MKLYVPEELLDHYNLKITEIFHYGKRESNLQNALKNIDGAYSMGEKVIVVRKNLSKKKTIEVVLHEIAHAYCCQRLGLTGKRIKHGESFKRALKMITKYHNKLQ